MGKIKRTAAALMAFFMLVGLIGCANTSGDQNAGSQEQTKDADGSADSADDGQNQGEGADAFSDGSGGKGRFLEKEIEFPEEIDHVTTASKLADGSISILGYNANSMQYYLLNSKDLGENWDSKAITGMEITYVATAAIAPDGSAFLTDHYGEQIYQVSADGTASAGTLALPQAGGDYKNQIRQSGYLDSGALVVLDMEGKLYRADLSAGTLEEISKNMSEEAYYFGIAGNSVVAVLGSGVSCINGETGEITEDDTLKQVTDSSKDGLAGENMYPYLFAAGAEENSIIYVNNEGLFFHQIGGTVSEQLINGSLVSLGDNSLGLMRAITVDASTYLVLAVDSLSTPRLYRYVYDAEASAVPEKQLKVYALEDSLVLQQAISYFQKQNPDVFVKKTIGLSGDDSITAEDALRTLSTDIMAGNGPDVLILDGIPVDSYVEKGILADLTGLIEEVESADGLFTNMKEAYVRDGKIYEMPSHFGFSVVEGEEEGAASGDSLEAFLAYAKEKKASASDQNVLPPVSASGLLYELYYADSASWQKEDGSLDEEQLKRYLQAAKEWKELEDYAKDEYNADVTNYTFRFGGMYNGITSSANWRLMQMGTASIGTLTDIDGAQQLYAVEQQVGGTYRVFKEKEGGSFVPYVSVGIAAGSADNADAQAFVKGLLGKECQTAASGAGFPVNRAAYEAEKKNQKSYSIGTSTPDGDSVGMEVVPLNEEQLDLLTKQIESLKRPILNDRVIQEMVVSEGISCLDGDQSPEDAAANIMQKVKLYLSE